MSYLLDEDFLRKLESLLLFSRRVMRGEGIGRHQTYRRGASLEFQDYREYYQGDDFRTIDLNILRRLNKPVVKVFAAEEDLLIHLFIDTSTSMDYGTPSKFHYAKKLAAAISFIGVSQLDRVKIVPVTNTPLEQVFISHQRGKSAPLFHFLESLEPGGRTDLNRALRSYAAIAHQPGLAVILSDLFSEPGIQDGLNALLYAGYDLLVIHILHSDEIHPGISGNNRLIDMESNESVTLFADKDRIDRYEQLLQDHMLRIEAFCIEHGIEYIRACTNIPVEELVFEYIKRGVHFK